MQKNSRYVSAPKRAAATNRLVLSDRAGSVIFWVMVTVIAGMIVAATYWLLTHSVGA